MNEQKKATYCFEVRDKKGYEVDSDKLFEITWKEAMDYARKIMAEHVDNHFDGQHILIVDPNSYETLYQGDFGYCGYYDGDPIIKTPRALEAEKMAEWEKEWNSLKGNQA